MPPEVEAAIALCNKRVEVVGADLYKVTAEVTSAVETLAASKRMDGTMVRAEVQARPRLDQATGLKKVQR